MTQITLTNKLLDKLKPSMKPYFLRDSSLKGFGVKVNPSGGIKFVAEVWYKGRLHPVAFTRKSDKTIQALMNGTRTFFRSMDSKMDTDNMLWTCYKDHRPWFKDGRFDSKRKKETFLALLIRTLNDQGNRLFLQINKICISFLHFKMTQLFC